MKSLHRRCYYKGMPHSKNKSGFSLKTSLKFGLLFSMCNIYYLGFNLPALSDDHLPLGTIGDGVEFERPSPSEMKSAIYIPGQESGFSIILPDRNVYYDCSLFQCMGPYALPSHPDFVPFTFPRLGERN